MPVNRLDSSTRIDPIEPPTLRIDLISPAATVDELIPVALRSRPELESRQAEVQMTLAMSRKEKLRPLIPSLVLSGCGTPDPVALGAGVYAAGPGDSIRNGGFRSDINVELLWQFDNLGLGNRARTHEREAESRLALIELFRLQLVVGLYDSCYHNPAICASAILAGVAMYLLVLAAMGAAPVEAPTFTAVSAAGVRPAGKLVRLEPALTATLRGEDESVVTDVISLRRSDRPLPPPPTGPQIITTTGDRIAGKLLGGDGQSLRFQPEALRASLKGGWKIPIAFASVVWLAATPADTPLDPSRYEWLAGNRNRDVVRSRNGDLDRGTLSGLEPDAEVPRFGFRPERGAPRDISEDELAAVAFNPALARGRKPKGSYLRVTLTDGSRLHLTEPSVEAGVLYGGSLFGPKVNIPVSEVLAMDVLQGKATYLSDLKPKAVEQSGYLDAAWRWAADRSVRQSPLMLASRVGDSAFDKGLGTHPRTTLTFALGGKYRRFEAWIGLDPSATVRGTAVVRIVVDGKEQTVPGLADLRSGIAIPAAIDVSGAKELTLVTDFGPSGGVGADVTWADARVVE